jgi:hypothetical protein
MKQAKHIIHSYTSGSLTLRDMDLTGLVFPKKISGRLTLDGCKLDGVQLPTEVSEWMSADNCDLSGVTLPANCRTVFARNANLKGVIFPTQIGWLLDTRGSDIRGVTFPKTLGGGLNVGGCDLVGVVFPTKIGGWLTLNGCDISRATLPSVICGKPSIPLAFDGKQLLVLHKDGTYSTDNNCHMTKDEAIFLYKHIGTYQTAFFLKAIKNKYLHNHVGFKRSTT